MRGLRDIALGRIARPRPVDMVAAVVVLGALGLRLYDLDGRSLWIDEVATATTARLQGVGDLGRWFHDAFAGAPDQAPVYYLVSSAAAAIDSGELMLRLPSAVFGALTVAVVYVLGARLFSSTAGLVAACLLAIEPTTV
ncbi:MAG TPA: glycosyltransferase family 39 protein, partial [Candidatus Dormibacteraeota bacterium]|nr:glycosyltransferase family 39 protein [Candidatus Dormibacteraeota bacterium]